MSTSGSTGLPLSIHLGPFERQWQRAAAWRILFENGYRWTDRTLEIRLSLGPVHPLQHLGIAAKDWLSMLDPPEAWVRCLVEGRHQVVVSTAGTLRALAEAVADLKAPIQSPRLVVSTGETLDPSTRALLRRVFGTEPIDVFGLVELSNFAWQCDRRQGYHVSANTHLAEVDAEPGQIGKLIVTDLGMLTMPIIRYDTGDMAVKETAPCPCGRAFPVMRHIFGRAIDSVVLPGGRRVFWVFFHELFAIHPGLKRWRIVQRNETELHVLLSLPPDQHETLDSIRRQLRTQLPDSMTVTIECKDHFDDPPGVKTSPIVGLKSIMRS